MKKLANGLAKSRTNSCADPTCTDGRMRRDQTPSTTVSCIIWITIRCPTDPAPSSTWTGRCWMTANPSAPSLRTSASVNPPLFCFVLFLFLFLPDCLRIALDWRCLQGLIVIVGGICSARRRSRSGRSRVVWARKRQR